MKTWLRFVPLYFREWYGIRKLRQVLYYLDHRGEWNSYSMAIVWGILSELEREHERNWRPVPGL